MHSTSPLRTSVLGCMPGAYFIKQQASFGKAEAAEDLFAHGSAAPPTQAKRPPRAGKQVQEEGKVIASDQLRIGLSCASGSVRPSSRLQTAPMRRLSFAASSRRFEMRHAFTRKAREATQHPDQTHDLACPSLVSFTTDLPGLCPSSASSF